MKTRLPFLNPEFLKNRIIWSIHLRWTAIIGVGLAVFFAHFVFHFTLPYGNILSILGTLVLLNVLYALSFRNSSHYSLQAEMSVLFIQIVVDIILLTFLIHFSGGVENPFYLFYIFHILITTILFPAWLSFILSGLIVIMFAGLLFLEARGVLPHFPLFGFYDYRDIHHLSILLSMFGVGTFVTTYIAGTFIGMYRRVKAEIDDKNEELELRNIENTKFFNFASHELKSPIIAIKSTLDAISANYEKELPGQALNLIERSSERSSQMLSMITELLDISRKQIKADSEDITLFSLNELIGQVIQHAQSVIQSKNLNVSTDLDEEIPPIRAPKYDFVQILNNLVFNAAYYTKANGGVKISSRLDRNHSEIIISIADSGIGIESEDMPKIFQEFYRGENAKQEMRFGTGLGLSLVKKLLESNGGRIRVESEMGKGSTFTLHLPLPSSADSVQLGSVCVFRAWLNSATSLLSPSHPTVIMPAWLKMSWENLQENT